MRLAAVAAAALALAGCGSGHTGSMALPSAGPSCAAVGRADSLTVTRVNLFPSNGLRFTFPPRIVAGAGKATGVPDPATAFRGCDPQGGLPCPKNATFTT
jgi:hypothetical protein